MIQAYSSNGLNQPAEGADAAEILTIAAPSAQAYVQLVQFAAQAGHTRKAELAAEKAIELASPDERDAVRQLVEQAKLAPVTQP